MSAAILTACGGLVLAHNQAVTHSWTTLPYVAYRYQYGVPAAFTFQPNPVPHQTLNSEQELDYRAQTAIHGDAPDTISTYLERLFFRMRFYRFFFFAPLYLAVLAFLTTIREWRFAWVVLMLLVFALGTNVYPYFYPHYIAAVTCLFVLIAVIGLERLNRLKGESGVLILCFCAAQFLFWYGAHLLPYEESALLSSRYESWDFINSGDPQGRTRIDAQLERLPGKQIVFVRYGPRHMFQEWIHNAADIDAARAIWVHDLGPEGNQVILKHYPGRSAWLLEPDNTPPQLTPYAPETSPFQTVQ
jgi:hypothetical protein